MRIRTNTAVWLDKYNRWQINVQKDGERKTFTSSKRGRQGQREVNAKADAWLENNLIDQRTKVTNLAKRYIEEKALYVGTSRLANIKGLFNKQIYPVLANKKVSTLTEQDLQNVLNRMFKKGYARTYIRECKKLLCDFMKFARKNNITNLMPEDLIVNKKAPKYERDTLQPIDIRKLFNSSKTLYNRTVIDDLYIYAYRFFVLTGLRRGELIGLKWNDIVTDIKGNKILYINRSINENNEITHGKTQNSIRKIPINDIMLGTLNKQRELQKKHKIKSQYIFTTKYGEYIRPATLTQRFKVYATYNNLSRHKLHELRHTFISLMQNDIPLTSLKSICGHSQKMDTLKIYGHEVDGELEKASSIINNKFLDVIS